MHSGGRAVELPGAAAFIERTPPDLLQAIRDAWDGIATDEQRRQVARWVRRTVMGELSVNSGGWESADEAISVARQDETETLGEMGMDDAQPVCLAPNCGKVRGHRGRHRNSASPKAAARPEAADTKPAAAPAPRLLRQPESAVLARFYVPVSLETLAALGATSVACEDGGLVARS